MMLREKELADYARELYKGRVLSDGKKYRKNSPKEQKFVTAILKQFEGGFDTTNYFHQMMAEQTLNKIK